MNLYRQIVLGYSSRDEHDKEENFEYCEGIVTSASRIVKKKYFNVLTKVEKKRFGFTFDKRVCVGDNNQTLPFGHSEIKM